MKKLCPGKSHFIKDAKDVEPAAFRRLVGRRARTLLGAQVGPVDTEKQRRVLESDIEEHFEKIHQQGDFLPASFLSEGAGRAQAVCRISTQTSLGTGFLIAPGILMTNNHVLATEAEAAASFAEFGFEEGGNTTVAAIQPNRLFLTDVGLDFSIVACDPDPVAELAPIPLLRDPATATRHDRVNVIQHPSGRKKEVALHDNRVERVQDKVIKYRTDTEPGSSGSPVFNNGWDLVALHHAGVSEPGGSALNEGVRISAIVAHLLNRNGEGLRRNETFGDVLAAIDDTSPYLGFFDTSGIAEPGSLEVEIPDFTGSAEFADVGVWNIEHFNNNISEQRLTDVADVVGRLSLDVLGLVEVQSEAMDRLVQKLGVLGFSNDFRLLDVPGSQDLAVLFDQDTTTVELRPDIAERHRERLDARTDSGKTAFPRDPLFAQCKVANGQGEDTEFILSVVHLKAFGDAQSRSRRRLAALMLSEIIDDVRRQEGIPVILGGDFNEPLGTDVLSPLSGAPDLFALTADDATTDAISFVGSSHRSLIDHVIVSRDVVLGEISGDDAAIVRLDQSVRDFSDRVSDHVPIVFRMIFGEAASDVADSPVDPANIVRIPLPSGAQGLRLEIRTGS